MSRNLSLDILKIILALSIVALHGKIFLDVNETLYFFTVNGIFRVGVPVFLLITGYYFFSIKSFKRWIVEVTVLYFFWMIFYSFFFVKRFDSWANTLEIIFLGYHHLWYLAGLIGGGILLQFFRGLKTIYQTSFAIFFFFLGCFLQYLGNFHVFLPKVDYLLNYYYIYRNFLTVCFPFLMFGYLIHKFNLTAKYKKIAPFAVIISLILLYVEVYINYFFISKTDPLDLMFFLMLLCPSLFIFVFNLNIKGQGKKLALFSTALYLIHPLFQNLLKSFNINSIELFLVTVVLSCLASIILIALNKKIKVIL